MPFTRVTHIPINSSFFFCLWLLRLTSPFFDMHNFWCVSGNGVQFAPTSTSDAILVNTTNGVTFLSYVIIFYRMFTFSKLMCFGNFVHLLLYTYLHRSISLWEIMLHFSFCLFIFHIWTIFSIIYDCAFRKQLFL